MLILTKDYYIEILKITRFKIGYGTLAPLVNMG